MSLFFQTFVLIGLCFILKYGSILNPIRNFLSKFSFFEKLFKCSLCLGFWVGTLFGIFWTDFITDIVAFWSSGIHWLQIASLIFYSFKIFQWSFYSAAVCWLADYLTMVFDKYLDSDKVDP